MVLLSSEVFLALCLLVAVVAGNIVLVFVLTRRARTSKVAEPKQAIIVAQKEERPNGKLFCTNCGAELPPKSKFCIECGTSSSDHTRVY
jgi:ribosomal protein L40E